MAGNTETEAFDNYARPLKAVLSCVTGAHIVHPKRKGFGSPQAPEYFAFSRNPDPLNESSLYLYFLQSFHVGPDERTPGQFKVFTSMYRYEVYFVSAQTKDEIIAYHWEPAGSAVSYPHIHIGFGARAQRVPEESAGGGAHGARNAEPPFDPKCHIPSGRVPIEDLVCFLINELCVVPLKPNWQEIVAGTRLAFMRNKSW